jgi:glycosyltransferase involved in cell wall biosynthesis
MPVRNEGSYLERSLGAVLRQDYPHERLEVIVVDGASDDATASIAADIGAGAAVPVTVLQNPARITPVSLNIGVRAAAGEYIIRVDGHCEIEADYVRRCVELLRAGHDCVGGQCITEGETSDARAIAAAQSSPFGVGNVAFRIGQLSAGPVDTVPFGAFPRSLFDRIGFFDEELVRNQDDEFTFRITQSGGVVWYDPAIRSRYWSRASLRGLWRQYFQYGKYKVRVLQKRGALASPRQAVPPLFVGALIVSAFVSVVSRRGRWVLAVAVPYAVANGAVATKVGRDSAVPAPVVAGAFATMHVSYGLGFLAGAYRWRSEFRQGSAT